MTRNQKLHRQALNNLYSPPVVTAKELGLDETPCVSCGHPAYQHYEGRLELGVTPGGRCHAGKCVCTHYQQPEVSQ